MGSRKLDMALREEVIPALAAVAIVAIVALAAFVVRVALAGRHAPVATVGPRVEVAPPLARIG